MLSKLNISPINRLSTLNNRLNTYKKMELIKIAIVNFGRQII